MAFEFENLVEDFEVEVQNCMFKSKKKNIKEIFELRNCIDSIIEDYSNKVRKVPIPPTARAHKEALRAKDIAISRFRLAQEISKASDIVIGFFEHKGSLSAILKAEEW